MTFDAFGVLNGFWGLLCVSVILPALVARKYLVIVTVGALILIANTIFLHFNQKMLLIEAVLRSGAVALVNILIAYLIAHFFHHKRSVLDLFRRINRP
ncbi:hypothetical protein HBO18_18005 [Pseudomonas lactis]|uniref:Uncharacterized protein n=1 Tax=Pseudomonas lactis TaxID=1615674 RepID=A0A219AAU9_9PSED|nr:MULTISPECIES: hypothetical protein [Pseudomonas]MDE1532216.1 hypothetical protein [Pseudomonas carnis]MDI3249635.1 hypothetical protein [Pseudomonas sp. AL10]MDI3267714.1 hypothetical protein [Pseudomonas sp. AL15]NNA46023.1 hypothetical protein [Pseudomonas lactis]OWQ43539.1 hypothetical protein CDH05_00995 [Pseudomonas lactis]